MNNSKVKYYVTMTDKYMSGWGWAEGKINKLIFECKDYKEAEIVADNAQAREAMKYINIVTSKPYYNNDRYYPQVITIEEYPNWYKEGSRK